MQPELFRVFLVLLVQIMELRRDIALLSGKSKEEALQASLLALEAVRKNLGGKFPDIDGPLDDLAVKSIQDL